MWDLIVKNKTLRGVAGDILSREGLRHRLQRNQEDKTTIFFKKINAAKPVNNQKQNSRGNDK